MPLSLISNHFNHTIFYDIFQEVYENPGAENSKTSEVIFRHNHISPQRRRSRRSPIGGVNRLQVTGNSYGIAYGDDMPFRACSRRAAFLQGGALVLRGYPFAGTSYGLVESVRPACPNGHIISVRRSSPVTRKKGGFRAAAHPLRTCLSSVPYCPNGHKPLCRTTPVTCYLSPVT